jgi:hypothetical protein
MAASDPKRTFQDGDGKCPRILATPPFLQAIKWASNAASTTVHDVRVDHGRRDFGMTQKLLDRADVLTPLE